METETITQTIKILSHSRLSIEDHNVPFAQAVRWVKDGVGEFWINILDRTATYQFDGQRFHWTWDGKTLEWVPTLVFLETTN